MKAIDLADITVLIGILAMAAGAWLAAGAGGLLLLVGALFVAAGTYAAAKSARSPENSGENSRKNQS